MTFLNGITLLLVFQLLGELTVLIFKLPIPGPVVGMVYLLGILLLRGKLNKSLEITSNGLLMHLSLLFVPAGVGMMVYFNRILEEWLPITLTLILSTVITMMTTALIMSWTYKAIYKKDETHE